MACTPLDLRVSLIKYDRQEVQTKQRHSSKGPQDCTSKSPLKNFELSQVLDGIASRTLITAEGKSYHQQISSEKSSRIDAIKFQLELDSALEDKQARSQGIDPVRRIIFSDAFDEIIRQTAVDCPPRGLLLLRIREEAQTSLKTYEVLYQSAVKYGAQIADEGYDLRAHLQSKIDAVEAETDVMRNRVESLKLEVDHTRKSLKSKREMEAKWLAGQVQFIKRANQQIRQETGALVDYHAPPDDEKNRKQQLSLTS